ncbi:MAG: hypothetical protein KatS3mg099_043 [Candidatus Parcubacteria bacterium]|nr:MAG: hypothetical protein KatS3mg099_043 [Candidatus Parcubacteria bacterium]
MKSVVRGTCDEAAAQEAARAIARGGVIIYPTDTLWGFGADPRNREAIERVYTIKGREPGKPLLLMVRDIAMAQEVAHLPRSAVVLARAFWPGGLSLVAPARAGQTLWGIGKNRTVGLRAPNHPFREYFFQHFSFPITSTSVNLSGEAPLRDFAEILERFGAQADVLVDDIEHPPTGAPSTVVDVSDGRARVVREGVVPREAVRKALAEAGADDAWAEDTAF